MKPPTSQTGNPLQEEALDRALAAKPRIAIPQDFAARVATNAVRVQQRPAAAGPLRGLRWGPAAAAAGLALLLVLMLRIATLPQTLPTFTVQAALCIQAILLCLWLPSFFRKSQLRLHSE